MNEIKSKEVVQERTLKLSQGIIYGIGCGIGGSIFILLGLGIEYAGSGLLLSLLFGGILIFFTGLKGNKSDLLLEVECEEIKITESQREAFIMLFKGNHTELFDLYWQKKQAGEYFDYSVAKELIENSRKN